MSVNWLKNACNEAKGDFNSDYNFCALQISEVKNIVAITGYADKPIVGRRNMITKEQQEKSELSFGNRSMEALVQTNKSKKNGYLTYIPIPEYTYDQWIDYCDSQKINLLTKKLPIKNEHTNSAGIFTVYNPNLLTQWNAKFN